MIADKCDGKCAAIELNVINPRWTQISAPIEKWVLSIISSKGSDNQNPWYSSHVIAHCTTNQL